MTKEEAIEHLKLIRLNAGMTGAESFKEALDLAIVSLSQPSLPSDLNEAAEEYAYNNWEDNDYHTGASEGLPFDAIGHTEKCFRAGAEWMAGQGITFEGKASRRYENGLAGFVSWILFDQQKAAHLLVNQGEEADVIINIRKK